MQKEEEQVRGRKKRKKTEVRGNLARNKEENINKRGPCYKKVGRGGLQKKTGSKNEQCWKLYV